jgi:hypothetical protein
MTVKIPAAQAEPEIDKNSISIHRVRRGDMPVRLMPSGEIVSLTPPEVLVMVPSGTEPSPQVGQRASVQIRPPEVMIGIVVDIDRATLLDSWKLTIRLKEPFPADATVGMKVGPWSRWANQRTWSISKDLRVPALTLRCPSL